MTCRQWPCGATLLAIDDSEGRQFLRQISGGELDDHGGPASTRDLFRTDAGHHVAAAAPTSAAPASEDTINARECGHGVLRLRSRVYTACWRNCSMNIWCHSCAVTT